jgi:hypothetical protein
MVGETIDRLVIEIQGDVRDAVQGINRVDREMDGLERNARGTSKSVDRSTGKMNKSFGTLKASVVATASAVVAAMGALSFKMVQLAGDAEEVQNKFESVFGSTAGEAERFTESFSNSVGRAETDIKKYMSTFQDTFVPLGFARDEGEELSEQLTQLSIDLASFNNEAEPATVEALQSALVGNHETMRRYGVIITQARLDQELMNMGLADGVQNASEMEKVQARLNIIMSGTADAQGDAARTADSFANQSRALKSSLRGVMEEAGAEALPELSETMQEFNEWGTSGGYDRMADGLGDIANAFAAAADAGAALTQTLVDLYTAATIQEIDVPKGMFADMGDYPHSGTMSIVPDLGEMSQKELNQLLHDNKQQFMDALDVNRKNTDTSEENTDEIKNQNSEIERQKELLSDTSIPSWAGKGSAYTKPMLEATGARNIDQLKEVPQAELEAAFDKNFGGKSVASNPASGVTKPAVAQNPASNMLKNNTSPGRSGDNGNGIQPATEKTLQHINRQMRKLDTINRSINNIDIRTGGDVFGGFGFSRNTTEDDVQNYKRSKGATDISPMARKGVGI